MKNILLNCTLVTLIIFMLSCTSSPKNNADEKISAWPQFAKDSFITRCTSTLKTNFEPEKSRSICNCILEKMMSKHPDTNEVKNMSSQEIMKESMALAPQCLFSK